MEFFYSVLHSLPSLPLPWHMKVNYVKLYEVNIIMQNQTTNTVYTIAVVVTAFTVVFQFCPANLAFFQAVDPRPINTGNETP